MPGEIFPDTAALRIPQALKKLYERGEMDLPTMYGMDPGTFQELASFVPQAELDVEHAAGFTQLPAVQVVLPGESPVDAHLRMQGFTQ